ncbi:hypothetical protein J8273_1096 [Carpediemonas membranifera]|uniref:Uncharacterized protein n=1 Tax=Carpediemonas membranifera TaxID=201153 RepID=A0A8J6BC68_9EUKA|nr:hypothetical protein J8273_1096 [Carpediemonas membranifera]|eukprot:KAG9397187.1 hypothetical protein J8273_1096 [Carpediemonas membranifera]
MSSTRRRRACDSAVTPGSTPRRRSTTRRLWPQDDRPVWMDKAAQPRDSAALDIEQALISAFRLSVAITSSISGDIPSLLRHAFSRHFNKVLPTGRDAETTNASESSVDLEALQDTLSRIPPLAPTAQVLLDRARSILADGLLLSMNVELAEGQELPVALHTLLQGTLWAILMDAGANPDVNGPQPAPADHTPLTDRCLWFLCKKFFFVYQVTEMDAEYVESPLIGSKRTQKLRIYAGIVLLARADDPMARFRLARMPRAHAVHTYCHSFIAVTPRGLFAHGRSYGHLGISQGMAPGRYGGVDGIVSLPSRIPFDCCPAIAQYEAELMPWKKDRLVKLIHAGPTTLISTPAGLAVASNNIGQFVNDEGFDFETRLLFHQVDLPDWFLPDHINAEQDPIIISMGDQQLICGNNRRHRLGIDNFTGFTQYPLHIDRIFTSASYYMIFLSGRAIYISGDTPVRSDISRRDLRQNLTFEQQQMLHGLAEWVPPQAGPQMLQFKTPVKAFYCDGEDLFWVSEGVTHAFNGKYGHYTLKYELTRFGAKNGVVYYGESGRFVQDPKGKWHQVLKKTSNRVYTAFRDMEDPEIVIDLIPVEVDPVEGL